MEPQDERSGRTGSNQEIVVGSDGSPRAMDAVRWAAREAGLRGASVRVVAAWELPPSVPMAGYPQELVDGALMTAEQNANEAAKEIHAIAPSVPVEITVAEGDAANVLVHAAAGASLLVVGCRGLGAFRELVLGSVSHRCAQHATCPVVVVR